MGEPALEQASSRPPGTLRLGLAVAVFMIASFVVSLVFIVANRPEPATGPPPPRPPLRVFAAASLAEPLRAIASAADAVTVELSLAATSAHERQIASGAACDVFIAASPAAIDRLVAQGLLDGDSRRTICENALVVVGPDASSSPKNLAELESRDRIAVGAKGVPAGDYAREALEHAGLLAKLEPRLASYPDEPSVLAAVKNGGAPVGLVYASSVRPGSGVQLAFAVDPKLHSKIAYVAAVARSSKSPALAHAFVNGFRSQAWKQKLRDAGFVVPQAP